MFHIQDSKKNWVIDKLQCVEAWKTTKGKGVIVAVLDAGINQKHEMFKQDVMTGRSYISPLGENTDALHQHGQSVASCVRAVAPEATILPVRVSGASNSAAALNIANGINYAVNNGAHVITISYFNITGAKEVKEACEYAAARGVTVVMATGNSGKEISLDAAENVIITSGSTASDTIWGKSNYGSCVDLTAPCEKVGLAAITPNQYGTGSGTSYAAPTVAGVVALIKSTNLNLTVTQVKKILLDSCDKLLGVPVNKQGAGRVNALSAVNRAKGGSTESPATFELTPQQNIIARILAAFKR